MSSNFALQELAFRYLTGQLAAAIERLQAHVDEHPKDQQAAIKLDTLRFVAGEANNSVWYAVTHLAAEAGRKQEQDFDPDDIMLAEEVRDKRESVADIGPSFDEMGGAPTPARIEKMKQVIDRNVSGAASKAANEAREQIDILNQHQE